MERCLVISIEKALFMIKENLFQRGAFPLGFLITR